jgi:hypothetical protein
MHKESYKYVLYNLGVTKLLAFLLEQQNHSIAALLCDRTEFRKTLRFVSHNVERDRNSVIRFEYYQNWRCLIST